MRIIMLEIPEDTSAWAPWMDQMMMSLDLGELVRELSATIAIESGQRLSLEEICPTQLPQITKRGFSTVTPKQIGELLKRPQLLLELQELILSSGSPFWDTVPVPSSDQAYFDEVGVKSARYIAESNPSFVIPPPIQDLSKPSFEVKSERKRETRSWIAFSSTVLALAATILITIGVSRRLIDGMNASKMTVHVEELDNTSREWGFDRPGLLTNTDVSGSQYLMNLANAAEDWFQVRPDSQQVLDQRLKAFSRGCSNLIAASNTPLGEKDRDWLVMKCKEWSGKIDGYRQELELGTDWEEVCLKSDETIRRLQEALRERVKLLG